MKRLAFQAVVALGVAGVAACNRADATREAREVAADVRTAAAEAGERLADSWLTARVQAKFFADDEIKARYIDVSSRDGTVTLRGFVESDEIRQRALQLARDTEEAAAVEDQLLIGRSPDAATASTSGSAATPPSVSTGSSPSGEVPDAMVTSLIQARYFVDPGLKVRTIDVATSNGVVTLRGKVASDDERAHALLLARTTPGVERVEDGLAIDASLAPAPATATAGTSGTLPSSPIPGATTTAPLAGGAAAARAPGATGAGGALAADTALERAVRARLDGDRRLRGVELEVSARDGVVMLQGTVANEAARQRALTLARGTEGVMQVVDRIGVRE